MCILELSIVLMYEFHYDYIKSQFDNKSELFFTEPENLMCEIKTEDVYENFKEMFVFSNYSAKSKYDDNSNKLVIGEMKDETGGGAMEEFVGPKAKTYSFPISNSKHKKAI